MHHRYTNAIVPGRRGNRDRPMGVGLLAVTAIMAIAALICAGFTVDLRLVDLPMLPVFLLAGITVGWSDRYQRSQTAASGEIVEPVLVRHG